MGFAVFHPYVTNQKKKNPCSKGGKSPLQNNMFIISILLWVPHTKNASLEVPFSKHLALLGLYCSWGSHIIHPKAMCMSKPGSRSHHQVEKRKKMLFVDQRFNDSSNISPSWKALNMKILQMSLSGISWHVASVTRKKTVPVTKSVCQGFTKLNHRKGTFQKKNRYTLWKPN